MESNANSTIFGSERGWNDPPPMLDVATSSSTSCSAGPRLNKRVGFPTSFPSQSSDAKSNQSSVSDAGAKSLSGALPPPPPPSLLTNIPCPSNKQTIKDDTKVQEDEVIEVKFEDVGDVLETCLSDAENCGALDEKKASDIRKRIDIFKDKWNNDKLNGKVQQGMLKLAQLMKSGDIEEAEKMQRNLNVEYPNLCTPWMIAIRQLILAQNKVKH